MTVSRLLFAALYRTPSPSQGTRLADEATILQADKLQTLVKAANVTDVEPIWASLFAKALEGKDVKDLLMNVGSGGPAQTTTTTSGPSTSSNDAEKAEEKKEGMIDT
jgi:large subunit ribosomal protein LP1